MIRPPMRPAPPPNRYLSRFRFPWALVPEISSQSWASRATALAFPGGCRQRDVRAIWKDSRTLGSLSAGMSSTTMSAINFVSGCHPDFGHLAATASMTLENCPAGMRSATILAISPVSGCHGVLGASACSFFRSTLGGFLRFAAPFDGLLCVGVGAGIGDGVGVGAGVGVGFTAPVDLRRAEALQNGAYERKGNQSDSHEGGYPTAVIESIAIYPVLKDKPGGGDRPSAAGSQTNANEGKRLIGSHRVLPLLLHVHRP